MIRVELGRFAEYPTLILGANSPTGQIIAKELAPYHCQIFAGATSEERYQNVKSIILAVGGAEPPQPFIADLTDPKQIFSAYTSLGMRPGTPINILALPARGLEGLTEMLMGMTKAICRRKITLEQATEDVALVLANRPDIFEDARKLNYHGLLQVTDVLTEGGHLGKGSVFATLNSSLADVYNLAHPERFGGPQFYRPVAASKKEFTEEMWKRTNGLEITYFDFVTPEIEGTPVGRLLKIMARVINSVVPEAKIVAQSVSREQVAGAMIKKFAEAGSEPRREKVYISRSGTSLTWPKEWGDVCIPYL